jgi:outer membrane biosynthesis protein TonB
LPQRDDSRPDVRRPSLFSADQHAAADANSILRQLDGKAGVAGPTTTPRKTRWLAGGGAIAVAALGGLALAWFYQAPVRHATETRMADASAKLTPVAVRAPEPAPVAAATILDDAPVIDPPALAAPGAGEKSLQQALTATPDPNGGKDDLVKLVDTPQEAQVARAAPPAPPKKKSEPKKNSAPKVAKAKPVKKSEPAVDSDVALLAALLAHSKTTRAQDAEQAAFRRCAALPTRAEAQRCRTRLCEGSAKGAPECKPIRTVKVTS